MPAAPRPLPALLYSHSYQPLLRIRRTAVKSKAPLKVRPGVSRIRLSSILYKTLPNKEPGRQRLHAPRQEEGKEKPERPPLRIRRFVARSTAPPSQQLEVPSQRLRVPGRRPIRVRIQTQPDSGHKTPHNKIEGEEKGHERRVIRRLVRPFRISPGQKETRLDLGNRARIIKLGSFLEDEGPGFSNDFQSTQDEKNPRNHIRNKTDDSKSNSGIMASDDAYAAFLEKANQPTSDPTQAIGGSGGKIGTYSVNRPVPEVLQSVEEYYVSDSDEPFEGVSLAFGGDKLDVDSLKALLGSSAADVSSLSVSDFDPSNQYKSVLDAVKSAAGNGEVKVFRVELAGGGGTRSEIWVVGLDEHGKSKRIVGLKALVVET